MIDQSQETQIGSTDLTNEAQTPTDETQTPAPGTPEATPEVQAPQAPPETPPADPPAEETGEKNEPDESKESEQSVDDVVLLLRAAKRQAQVALDISTRHGHPGTLVITDAIREVVNILGEIKLPE